MFNAPFNTGKFNVNIDNDNLYGHTTLEYSGKAFLSVKKNLRAEANLLFSGKNTVIVKRFLIARGNILYTGAAKVIAKKFFAGSGNIILGGSLASINLFGYEAMILQGLALKPGDELRIDTEEMTVTLNGQDITYCFSPESDFFHIQPGDNLLVYEDNIQTRNIEIKYLWRDKWL